MILVFCMLSFKLAFSFSFTFTTSEVKGDGQKELSHTQALGRQLGGDTLCLRLRAAAGRSYPTSKEWWLRGHGRAERSYSTFKVRRGGCEEIPLVQGKDLRLCFAGAAVKRYPTSKVRETQVRR